MIHWPAGSVGARIVTPREVALQDAGEPKKFKSYVQRLKGTAILEDYSSDTMPYLHPDDLVGRKGLSIYREMMDRDDAVASSVSYLGLAALSTGWEIQPASDDPADQEAADFASAALDHLKGSPNQMLLTILDAIGMGFSFGEKVWAKIGDMKAWPTKQGLHKIAPRNPVYIMFQLDAHDEIVENGVCQVDSANSQNVVSRVDLKDGVYHVYDSRDGSPYGRTPSRRAYRFYFKKDGAIKLYARYMERHGLPIAYGRYPVNADSSDQTALKTAVKELRSSLSGIMQEDWSIELLEPKLSAHELFNDSITLCNKGIYRAYLIPDLVVQSSEVGAYSLGKEHADQFMWVLDFIRDSLAETVNTQIIAPIIEHNFSVTDMPSFQWLPFAREDMQAKATVAEILGRSGARLSVLKMREMFGEYLADDDEESVERAQPPQMFGKPAAADDEDEAAADFTEIIWDAAHGNLPKSYSFASTQKAKDARAREKVGDALGDNRGANIEDAIAEELWGAVVGSELAIAAETLEGQVGKANGARRQG